MKSTKVLLFRRWHVFEIKWAKVVRLNCNSIFSHLPCLHFFHNSVHKLSNVHLWRWPPWIIKRKILRWTSFILIVKTISYSKTWFQSFKAWKVVLRWSNSRARSPQTIYWCWLITNRNQWKCFDQTQEFKRQPNVSRLLSKLFKNKSL